VPQTPDPLFVPGVWGPYKVRMMHWSGFERLICKLLENALFPNWWMNEGGQSATGEVRFFHSP
jgi:ribulose kinase